MNIIKAGTEGLLQISQTIAKAGKKAFSCAQNTLERMPVSDEFSKKSSVLNPKMTALADHHEINSLNCTIRDYMKYKILAKEGTLTPFEQKRLDRMGFLEEVIEALDKEFNNLVPLEKKQTFYRGMSKHPIVKRFNEGIEILDKAKVGDIVVPDTAYAYTGFKESLAKSFANGLDENMLLEIRAPKGAKLSRNLEHGGEAIFPRGAEYKVVSKSQDNNGLKRVVLEYILPKKR